MTNVHIFKHKTFYERNEITITTYSVAFANTVVENDAVNLILAHFNNSGKFLETEFVSSHCVFFFQQLFSQFSKLTYYSNDLDLFMAGNVMVDVIGNIYSDHYKVLTEKILPLMSFEDNGMQLIDLSRDEQLKKVTINTFRVLECLTKEAWVYELENLSIEANIDELYNKYLEDKLLYIARIKNDPMWSKLTGETADYIEMVTSMINIKHPFNKTVSSLLEFVEVFAGDLNEDFTITKRVK